MSKRHQANRRKAYGRRQHELHERRQRDHVPESADAAASTTRRGRRHRPTASRSSTRARRACTSRSASSDGGLPGRAPAHRRPAAPAPACRGRGRRGHAAAPPRPASARPRAPRPVPDRPSCSRRSSSRSPARSSRWPRTSGCAPPATSSTASRPSAQRLDASADDLRNELNRLGKAPAIRKLAIDAGLGPLPEPDRHPRPLEARIDRCSAGPTLVPARSCCSSPSWSWRARSACGSRTGR